MLVGLWELLSQSQRHTPRDDRHLVDRVSVREKHGQERVTSLMNRRDLLLVLADDHRAALGAHQHLVLREFEVVHPHELLAVARRVQRGLVDEVRKVRTRESRRPTCKHMRIHVIGQRDLSRMYAQNSFAALHIRTE